MMHDQPVWSLRAVLHAHVTLYVLLCSVCAVLVLLLVNHYSDCLSDSRSLHMTDDSTVQRGQTSEGKHTCVAS